MVEFTARAALKELLAKSSAEEARYALEGLINRLPDPLDHSDMSSTVLAGDILTDLTNAPKGPKGPQMRGSND